MTRKEAKNPRAEPFARTFLAPVRKACAHSSTYRALRLIVAVAKTALLDQGVRYRSLIQVMDSADLPHGRTKAAPGLESAALMRRIACAPAPVVRRLAAAVLMTTGCARAKLVAPAVVAPRRLPRDRSCRNRLTRRYKRRHTSRLPPISLAGRFRDTRRRGIRGTSGRSAGPRRKPGQSAFAMGFVTALPCSPCDRRRERIRDRV